MSRWMSLATSFALLLGVLAGMLRPRAKAPKQATQALPAKSH